MSPSRLKKSMPMLTDKAKEVYELEDSLEAGWQGQEIIEAPQQRVGFNPYLYSLLSFIHYYLLFITIITKSLPP